MKGQRSGYSRRANLLVRDAHSLKVQAVTSFTNSKSPPNGELVESMVGMKGLEPSRLAALVPKTSVYTNFTTSPRRPPRRTPLQFCKALLKHDFAKLVSCSDHCYLTLIWPQRLGEFFEFLVTQSWGSGVGDAQGKRD